LNVGRRKKSGHHNSHHYGQSDHQAWRILGHISAVRGNFGRQSPIVNNQYPNFGREDATALRSRAAVAARRPHAPVNSLSRALREQSHWP
jgi:hypothetical protein